MHFDLTPQIHLDEKNARYYRAARPLLYLFSFLLASYLAFRILFPSLFFEFSFNNPKAKSNTITNPRTEDAAPIEKGVLSAGKKTAFDASLIGTYSTVLVSFTLDKKSPTFTVPDLTVRKAHAAFLYPEGKPMGFRDGTLLKNKTDFYIVSEGKLRKFPNAQTVDALGFPQNGFIAVEEAELEYNPSGRNLTQADGYPADTLFLIQNNYYLLRNDQLRKFVSDAAFLTHYRSSQAIEKNPDFLTKYPLSDEPVGFSDGSLLSYADSIYVVDGRKISPIDNPFTFTGKGFDWNDVIQASADEVALYEKEKLFTIANSHPTGTIFTTSEDQRHYLIQDNQKHLLPGEEIFASWTNTTPIRVSQKSLDITSHCQPQKSFFQVDTLKCAIPITTMQNLIGSDYLFSLQPETKIILDTIQVEFKKDVGLKNLRFTLSELINRVKNNYAQ